MDEIMLHDMENICGCEFIEWDMLKAKTILVTGATGLIGINVINALSFASLKKNLNIKIIALVRNIQKAREIFSELPDLSFIVSDVECLNEIDAHIDYIIHGASPTSSRYFSEYPVETISTALKGTINILRIAHEKKISGMVYLSSMEVYGHVSNERLLSEKDLGYIDPLSSRNSYPESKRICEAMCAAYAHEYNLPSKIIRLVMTFGPGIHYDDSRVCAEFMRNVIECKDIILKTEGRTKRCYLYTSDAVAAILTVLLKGSDGHAYNAANPETYCSVHEMAEILAGEISQGRINVKTDLNQDVSMYPAASFLNLDVSAIKNLGWYPKVNLVQMYKRTIEYIQTCHAKI